MKKVIVISLGGSLIVPDKVNIHYLERFKNVLRNNYKTHRFVVVCGGGSIARKYISILKAEGKSKYELAQAGIMTTRMNARLMMHFFGKEANDSLPRDMKDVKDYLAKNEIVFCGALRFNPNSTSDGTAARLANFFKCPFINITNIKGLYTANPLTNPKAKFIPAATWKQFEHRALSLSFHAGQHFVLDQQAAVMIRKHKVPTYIIQNSDNISKILKGKKFVGTIIQG